MAEAGKGSRPRPFSVDQQTFDSNWETIFGRKEQSSESDSEDKEITDHSNEDQ